MLFWHGFSGRQENSRAATALNFKDMDKPTDIRLRELIEKRFPGRSRFTRLEASSRIPQGKWKNFFYRKQSATQSMLAWWPESFPEDWQYLMLGTIRPSQKNFPFNAPVPDASKMQSVGNRMRWVIVEWCGDKEAKIFEFLEQSSEGRVTASEWARCILGTQQPTLAMLEVVCNARPIFGQWVIRGTVSNDVEQCDPRQQITPALIAAG